MWRSQSARCAGGEAHPYAARQFVSSTRLSSAGRVQRLRHVHLRLYGYCRQLRMFHQVRYMRQGSPATSGGAKPEVGCLAWNRKVQHILASGHANGTCVVWDLKKQKHIISFRNPAG